MDYTRDAIERQLGAMGCARYELGILHDRGMLLRDWDASEVFGGLGFLKAMNAKGSNIYIRPSRNALSALVLVDDVNDNGISLLESQGLSAACIVETSPANFQLWFKFGQLMCPDLRKALARNLASLAGGDPASADAFHFGRLAGFTNRKPKHGKNGRFPFCLCRKADADQLVPDDHPILRQARYLAAYNDLRRSAMERARPKKAPHGSADEVFREYFEDWLGRQPGDPDYSAGDWGVCCRMIRDGFDLAAVEGAILSSSPKLADRKGNRAEAYAKRTALKASRRGR